MIIAMTSFALPAAITTQEARLIFMSTAPKYQQVPGLLKKHYILSEDGKTAGGIYLWNSRAEAEAMYTPEWYQFVEEKYQTKASVTFLASPVTVDNVDKEIYLYPD